MIARAALVVLLVPAVPALSALAAACGTDVDLGGTMDAGEEAAILPVDCGTLVAPAVTSSCEACDKSSSDCQPNGCYGGYWCDEATRDCQSPPKSCP